MGLTEFFAMEASEYLERLDSLVSSPTRPDTGEFVRLTRALRGSALMARQSSIAAAAAAFERFARACREADAWDESLRQRAVRAVDDLKILVRQAGRWSDAEERRARDLVRDLAPDAPTDARAEQAGIGLDSGARAFIGREGAAVASALDQAAKALQQNPMAHDAVQRVLSVAQPLRGLSNLSDVPPLGDLLEGVEQAVAQIVSRREPLKGAPLLLDAAAKAVARSALELATDGSANAEADEVQRFAGLLGQTEEGAVISIEALFHQDEGPHVIERGTVPVRRRVLGHVELVSHGEHLVQAAHDLEQAISPTQRSLRAQSLMPTFRALTEASGNPVLNAIARFAASARDAVARGDAVAGAEVFAARLREAGHALVDAATGDERELAQTLHDATAALEALRQSLDAKPRVEAPPPHEAVRAPESADAMPAPATTPGVAEQSASKPLAADLGEPGLEASWARFEQLLEARGLGSPSLDELIGATPPKEPAAEKAAEGAPAEPRPRVDRAAESHAERAAAAPIAPVPITDLCYSGRDALVRAAGLRRQITDHLAAGAPSESVRDLIEEVLDLVDLGLRA
jgi:hypothetical protein